MVEGAPPPPGPPPPPPPSSARANRAPPSEAGDPGKIAQAAIEARETGILDLREAGLAKFPVGLVKLAGTDLTKIDISGNKINSLPSEFSSFNKETPIKNINTNKLVLLILI